MLPTTLFPTILRNVKPSNMTKMVSSTLNSFQKSSLQPFSTSPIRFEADKRPLGPGNAVPKFLVFLNFFLNLSFLKGKAVVNREIKTIAYDDKSADYNYAGKWLVFFFYPLDFTFVCPTEIIAFSERVEEFQDLGAELIACSCDSHFSHLAWVNTKRENGGLGKMEIPILSDYNKQIATDFGVLDKSTGIPYRGLFIIDQKGLIRHTLVNDLPIGRSVDEAYRVLSALKYFEEHGEVCPADWEEGDDTIDVKSPKDYFKEHARDYYHDEEEEK